MSAPRPGSPEWRRLMSASKVGAVLGVSPYQSPYGLWLEMKGLAAPEPENEAMRRGQLLEDAILDWWEFEHLYEDGARALDRMDRQVTKHLGDWGVATLDGLAVEPDGTVVLVEAKTALRWDEWGEPGTDAVPAHYYAQALWQLATVPEAPRVHIPVLGPFLDFREYVIERDDALIADLTARCRAFYDSLRLDTPPPLDDHPATLATLRRAHPDIEPGAVGVITDAEAVEYLDAETDLSRAEARARGAKAVILAAADRAQFIETSDGHRIARRQASGRGVSLRRTATQSEIEGEIK